MTLRHSLAAAALATVALSAAAVEPTIHVSVGGQISPGVYGRVDFGNAPPPPVLYPQPVIIAAPPRAVVVQQQPLYLHVPPGHAKNWRKHCRHYNACGQQVYFVKSAEYEPGYRREREREEHGRGRGKGRGHGHDD